MSAQTQPLPQPAAQPQPSPQLFFETINAYQRTAALKTAIELDLFTAIAEGEHTAEAIALRTQASVRGIRILADALTVIGFLAKHGERYALLPDAAVFLDKRSPQYIGGAVEFLSSPYLTSHFNSLTAAVRRGGSASGEELEPDHPMWATFARSMAAMMSLPAELTARLLHAENAHPCKVLDIAAGHGMYGIAIARHNRNAEIHAVDWPTVLQVARENAEKSGVIDNWHALSGSAFDVEFGSGYDIALVTNFLHHFDPPTVEKLLRKIHRALAPNGRAVILEFVPNEDRISPPQTALFSLIMLTGTPGGDAYTFPEYERMCRNAGFSSVEMRDLPPSFSRVILAQA
jgi:ubiquinone/menaquinone biosynthesis C-methylase UbiE